MPTKRILILVVLLALLTAGCSGSASAPVFKTPEDAITSYFQGLAQNDFQKIAQACAITEMSEKFKYDLYSERLKAMLPVQSLAPTDYPFYVEANKTQLASEISRRVKVFAYSLLSDEAVSGGSAILVQDDTARINRFMKDVDPQKLSQLKLEKIGLPNKQLMSDAKYLENAAALAGIYGADESTERVALFSFNGNSYYLGFSLLRYGDNWKISNQVSSLAGTSPQGDPAKTTAEEFEKMISGN